MKYQETEKNKNNKIAFVLSNLSQGGSERQMTNISAAVAMQGVDVDLITYYDADFYKAKDNTNVNYINLCENNKLKRIIKIRNYYKKASPKTVITLVDRVAIYALIASFGLNIKFVLTWRNNNTSVFNSATGKIIKIFRKKIKKIICNSQLSKLLWIKYCPDDSNKVEVIYNLINKNTPCNNYKAINNCRTIIIPARVVPDKNAIGLIEAINALGSDSLEKLKIKWYGNPDDSHEYYNKVIALKGKYELDKNIEFLPAITNIIEEMKKADCVALFSMREGLPNAICEGLQLGKMIMMTPVSDYNSLIEGNGIVCESSSYDDIKKALEEFVNCSNEEIEYMGSKSLKIFNKLFNAVDITNRWRTIIEE